MDITRNVRKLMTCAKNTCNVHVVASACHAYDMMCSSSSRTPSVSGSLLVTTTRKAEKKDKVVKEKIARDEQTNYNREARAMLERRPSLFAHDLLVVSLPYGHLRCLIEFYGNIYYLSGKQGLILIAVHRLERGP